MIRPDHCTSVWYASAVTGVLLELRGGLVRWREFIKGIAGSAAWPLVAQAQQTGKLATVGYLGPSLLSLEHVQVDALKQRLHELGYVEGKDIAYVFRWAGGHDGRFPALATELVGLKPDVIVTTGTPGTLAARRATSTIPIVFASSVIRSAPALSRLILDRWQRDRLYQSWVQSSKANVFNCSRRLYRRSLASPSCGIRPTQVVSIFFIRCEPPPRL
jgi:hypothetical protein